MEVEVAATVDADAAPAPAPDPDADVDAADDAGDPVGSAVEAPAVTEVVTDVVADGAEAVVMVVVPSGGVSASTLLRARYVSTAPPSARTASDAIAIATRRPALRGAGGGAMIVGASRA